jgi:hypothetical protein
VAAELLIDAFERIRTVVHSAVDGASASVLSHRVDDEANTVAWLVWHLARVQDAQIADAAGVEQLWLSAGWASAFDLPFATSETGYGQDAEAVGAVRASAEQLAGYYDAVHERTLEFIRSLDDGDFDRIVDESWNPPVTLGVRLVSILSDDLQHAGQASYVRGLAERAAS